MNNTLQLKHLASYLPYGLKLIGNNSGNILTLEYCRMIDLKVKEYVYNTDYYDVKPLLHPLERLTEPILEGGKTPLEWLDENMEFKSFNPPVLNDGTVLMQHWEEYQKLFEWHFDVFSLIPQGLAEPIEQNK